MTKGLYQQLEEQPVFDPEKSVLDWDEILKRMDSQGEPIHLTVNHRDGV